MFGSTVHMLKTWLFEYIVVTFAQIFHNYSQDKIHWVWQGFTMFTEEVFLTKCDWAWCFFVEFSLEMFKSQKRTEILCALVIMLAAFVQIVNCALKSKLASELEQQWSDKF